MIIADLGEFPVMTSCLLCSDALGRGRDVASSSRGGVQASGDSTLGHALGTSSPVGHFGFVDLVALIVVRREARSLTDRAVDVDDAPADPTDQVMMVVVDPVLVSCGGTDGLDPPYQPLLDQYTQGVVHGLTRDRPDLRLRGFDHVIGTRVRELADGVKDRYTLGGRLDAVLTQGLHGGVGHANRLHQFCIQSIFGHNLSSCRARNPMRM